MTTFGKTVLYVIYGVIVAGLVIAIATSFHHNSKSPQQPATGSGSSQTQTQNPQQQNHAPQPSPNPKSGTATPQSGATSTPSTSSAPSQLNNTGPGDTVAIFMGVAVVGAVLYRRHLILKAAE
jgi:cytoskeletal protein RodZ